MMMDKELLPEADGDGEDQQTMIDFLMGIVGIGGLVICSLLALVNASDAVSQMMKQRMEYAVSERIKAAEVAARQKAEQQQQIQDLEYQVTDEVARKKELADFNEQLMDKLEEVTDELADLKKKQQRLLAAKRVSVVVVLDVTGSMSEQIARLKIAIGVLGQSLPKILTEFELGFIVYRDGQTHQRPITRIASEKVDGGASLDALNQAIENITASGGRANVAQAMRQGMHMLDNRADGQRQLLFLLGDVGCGEMSTHRPDENERLIREVDAWSKKKIADRRVLALYAGSAKDSSNKDRAFFEELGRGDKNVFATGSASMVAAVVEAAFVD